MVKENVRPVRYWESAEGRAELEERVKNVLDVGRYKPQLAVPDPDAFHRRMDKAAELGRLMGYDVLIAYGDGADSAVVRYFGGGYNTLFAEICLGIGTHSRRNPRDGRAFIADFELGKMARHYVQNVGLEMQVYQVKGLGLTGEIYENVVAFPLEQILKKIAGKDQNLRIGIITSKATNSQGFPEHVREAAAKIPRAEVIMDNTIMPHLLYNKDEAEIAAARRMALVAGAMLDVGLALSSPNVREGVIAGYMEQVGRYLGATAFDWRVLIGSGEHNNATISDALQLRLPRRGPINIGGCPYGVVPVPVAPTERGFSWIGADSVRDVPRHVREAYNALLDYFFAGKEAFEHACAKDGPAAVWYIDQAGRDALEKHNIRMPSGKLQNMLKARTYSLAHIMGPRECGLMQNGRNSGDITFEAKHNLPDGLGLWGLDAGAGGQGYEIPYLVCEKTAISNRDRGIFEVLAVVPVELGRILDFTGTGNRTPGMYKNPLARN
jgi:hypothetical protein